MLEQILISATIVFTVLVFAIIFFLIYRIQKKKKKNWETLKQRGKAAIVGWSTRSGADTASGQPSKRLEPMAKVIGIENQRTWVVENLPCKYKNKYPGGSIIDVEYAEYQYMGVKIVDIRFIGNILDD